MNQLIKYLLKLTSITNIFIISALVQAAPKTPYFEYVDSTGGGKLETLVIRDTKESRVYLFGCSVEKTTVRYLGDSPVCSQNVTCSRGETIPNGIVEHSTAKITAHCSISSASAGCRSQTWQKCVMDPTLPDDLQENCLSDNPGTAKPGCPKMNPQGFSQQSDRTQ